MLGWIYLFRTVIDDNVVAKIKMSYQLKKKFRFELEYLLLYSSISQPGCTNAVTEECG